MKVFTTLYEEVLSQQRLALSVVSAGLVTIGEPLNADAASNKAVVAENEQVAKITNIKPLNTMTLQITFNQPLAAA